MNLTRRIGLFAALLTLLPGAAAAAPPAAAADQAGAAPLPVAEPESGGMSSERLQRLSEAMAGYIDRKQVAGIVTLVARRSSAHPTGRSATSSPPWPKRRSSSTPATPGSTAPPSMSSGGWSRCSRARPSTST